MRSTLRSHAPCLARLAWWLALGVFSMVDACAYGVILLLAWHGMFWHAVMELGLYTVFAWMVTGRWCLTAAWYTIRRTA